jgi:hypothetical protein
MEQQAGWESVKIRGLSVRPIEPGVYRYEFRVVPDTNHMLRRTARAHAKRLQREHDAALLAGAPRAVRFLDEKRRRGPFGWHVVRRTKVPA